MLACKLYQRFDSNHVGIVYKIGYDDVAGVSTASPFILSFSTKIITIPNTTIPIHILLEGERALFSDTKLNRKQISLTNKMQKLKIINE